MRANLDVNFAYLLFRLSTTSCQANDAALTDSTVEKAGAVSPLSGCQGGIGVQAGNRTTGQVGHVDLSRDTIETYQKNGIAIKGAGSTGDIDHTVETGAA